MVNREFVWNHLGRRLWRSWGTSVFAGVFTLYLKQLAVNIRPDYVEELTDDDLVALCQIRGLKDDRPFRELFHRYQRLVWRACYSVAGNAEDAEDLTQEVFFKVYRALPDFEGRSSFKTWIYRIALNTSKNELRRRSRRPQVSETGVDDMAEFLPTAVSVESEWQKRHQQEKLTTAMAQLREEEFEIIRLKDLEQRSYQEIAEILDISVSAAKMRAQRSRLALKVAYKQVTNGFPSP